MKGPAGPLVAAMKDSHRKSLVKPLQADILKISFYFNLYAKWDLT